MTTFQPPVECPRCHAEIEPMPIMYGYPSPQAMQQSEAGHLLLGGCLVGPESPEFACPECAAPLPLPSDSRRSRRRRTVTSMDMDT